MDWLRLCSKGQSEDKEREADRGRVRKTTSQSGPDSRWVRRSDMQKTGKVGDDWFSIHHWCSNGNRHGIERERERERERESYHLLLSYHVKLPSLS